MNCENPFCKDAASEHFQKNTSTEDLTRMFHFCLSCRKVFEYSWNIASGIGFHKGLKRASTLMKNQMTLSETEKINIDSELDTETNEGEKNGRV